MSRHDVLNDGLEKGGALTHVHGSRHIFEAGQRSYEPLITIGSTLDPIAFADGKFTLVEPVSGKPSTSKFGIELIEILNWCLTSFKGKWELQFRKARTYNGASSPTECRIASISVDLPEDRALLFGTWSKALDQESRGMWCTHRLELDTEQRAGLNPLWRLLFGQSAAA